MSLYKNQSFRARLGFALQGLAHAARAERSLQVQLVAFAAALAALGILRPSALWWALVLLASAGVIAAELFQHRDRGARRWAAPAGPPRYSHREGLRGRRRAHRGARGARPSRSPWS